MDGYTMVKIPQTMKVLNGPTKFFRELVLRGKIVHDGSPLLTWCLSNAMEIEDTNGNIKLSKKNKDDSQRIDLIAAIINAMARAMIGAGNIDVSEFAEEDVLEKLWG
ncbi:terminase TerL endonuclease subunit [Paenibacillus silviterrae]|nr:terminase TerL endonuclease subunit [Paenibacillus chinjuensis]